MKDIQSLQKSNSLHSAPALSMDRIEMVTIIMILYTYFHKGRVSLLNDY
ncbi:hypothetical protein [Halalkalibacter hemicellulosilyticus]